MSGKYYPLFCSAMICLGMTTAARADLPAWNVQAFSKLTPAKQTEFVLSALQAREQELQNFHYSLKETFQSRNEKGNIVPVVVGTVSLQRSGVLLKVHVESMTTEGKGKMNFSESWDGKVGHSLEETRQPIEYIGTIFNHEPGVLSEDAYNQLLGYRVIASTETMSEWLLAKRKFYNDASDALRAKGKFGDLHAGLIHESSIDQLEIAIQYDAFNKYAYWIDPAKDYLPIKWRWSNTVEGQIMGETTTTVDESKQIDGLWIPMKMTDIRVSHGLVRAHNLFAVDHFDRKVPAPADLKVTFPPNTVVTNTTDMSGYIIKPDGTKDPIPFYDTATGTMHHPPATAPSTHPN